MIGLAILFGFALILLVIGLSAALVHEMRHPPRRTAGYALAHGMPTDPGDIGLQFEQWMLPLENGVTLPVWDVKGAAPLSEKKATVVMLHGWGHSRIHSLERIHAYLPHCHRVLLYDLRGHGESSRCLSRLGDGEQDDLIALLKASNRNELDRGDAEASREKFVLVGHSIGAVIALKAVAKLATIQEPTVTIACIVAYGPYTRFHRSLIGRLKVAGFPTRPMTDLALLWHRLRGVVPLSLRDDDLRKITCPVLIVHGTSDVVAPLEHGKHIAHTLRNATLEIVQDATHLDAHRTDLRTHKQNLCVLFERINSADPIMNAKA